MSIPVNRHRLWQLVADAVLIGTALSATGSPEGLLGELSSVLRHGR